MARLAFIHPNRKRLLTWLEQTDAAGDTQSVADVGITAHVEQCERCADKLEELSGEQFGDEIELAPGVGAVLRQIFEPPPGINDRVMLKIDERERAAREMNLFLGLFGIATDAADLMMPDD